MQTSAVLNFSLDEPVDNYTASIEISNACREFYKSRLEATLEAKLKLRGTSAFPKRETTIDNAMQKLRKEMSELMDQDLSLIKQLLTLNETIEELKWQRKHYLSKCSLVSLGSLGVQESDWSVSETDMFESENDLNPKYPTPSKLSLEPGIMKKCSFGDLIEKNFPHNAQERRYLLKNTLSTPLTNSKNATPTELVSHVSEKHARTNKDEKQNSFDSGIHDPAMDQNHF